MNDKTKKAEAAALAALLELDDAAVTIIPWPPAQ